MPKKRATTTTTPGAALGQTLPPGVTAQPGITLPPGVTLPQSGGSLPPGVTAGTLGTTTKPPKRCTKISTIDSVKFVPADSLKTSSKPEDAENLRPSSRRPWLSAPGDRKPWAIVELPPKTPIMEFDLPKNRNIKEVVVEFSTDRTTVSKVCSSISQSFSPLAVIFLPNRFIGFQTF